MARWEFKDSNGMDARLPTEFNHYEGALARTLGLPTLVLVQQDVMRRVVFDPTYGGFVGESHRQNQKPRRGILQKRARRGRRRTAASHRESSKNRRNSGQCGPKLAEDRGVSRSIRLLEDALYARRDVFLGYCSSSRATAASLKYFLQSTGATILDWQTDFIAGRSILAQIEEAASRCNAGIFLFTKDDDLVDKGQPDVSAPRDNVVFEAGYFIGLKARMC